MRVGSVRDGERLRTEVDRRRDRLAALATLAASIHERHLAVTLAALDQNLAALHDLAARTMAPEQRGWRDPAWSSFSPALRASGPIRAGQLREVRTGTMLGIPALVPGPRSGCPLVVRSRQGQSEAATALLQSLLVRHLLCAGPVRTTVVDPAGRGASFPVARWIPDLELADGDDLDHLVAGLDGTPQVVAVAGYPGGYDRRALASLRVLIRSTPSSGVDLLVHHQVDATAPEEPPELAGAVVVDLAERSSTFPGMEVDVVFDPSPPAEVARPLLARLGDVSRAARTLWWADLEHPPEDRWWHEDATDRIKAPVGRRGSGETLEVHFGVDGPDDRLCAHGVVVAMTGAGKTALFHSLIASLAVRYGPDELQLYLLDGKGGVGFAGYHDLPHAAVISLRTRPAAARSVLADLQGEMLRRHEVFKRHGVEHFAAYRAVGSPEGRLPRLLLVADEYQLLFDDDREGRAAADLLRLSEQARSAGIHLLLGSQHFAPPSLTHRNLIFANLHLRMALQMATTEVNAAADFGPAGRRLIATTCTRSGRVVVNDRAGDDTANRAATVAYLPEEPRAALVSSLAQRWGPAANQVVLDGEDQPELSSDPLLDRLGDAAEKGPGAVQELARRSMRDGGLGCADWAPTERPVALVLGRTLSVRGQAVVVLRRRRHEHLCIIGESHGERTATLTAAITSACLQIPPGDLLLRIVDRALPGTPWSSEVRGLAERVRDAGYQVDLVDDDDGAVRLITEAGAADGRTTLVVLVDADRVTPLARIPDAYGYEDSELGARLGRLLDEGGPLGVHVLASFTTVSAARVVLADRRLQIAFRHRVAMQMSDDDSFTVVASAAASRLQVEGPRPVVAVLFDRQANRGQVFKPFGPGRCS